MIAGYENDVYVHICRSMIYFIRVVTCVHRQNCKFIVLRLCLSCYCISLSSVRAGGRRRRRRMYHRNEILLFLRAVWTFAWIVIILISRFSRCESSIVLRRSREHRRKTFLERSLRDVHRWNSIDVTHSPVRQTCKRKRVPLLVIYIFDGKFRVDATTKKLRRSRFNVKRIYINLERCVCIVNTRDIVAFYPPPLFSFFSSERRRAKTLSSPPLAREFLFLSCNLFLMFVLVFLLFRFHSSFPSSAFALN